MARSSGPEVSAQPPALAFAVGELSERSGGIAELSRQAFKALAEMVERGQIRLKVHVLNESDGEPLTERLSTSRDIPVRLYSGNRKRFSLGVLLDDCDYALFDHVGLARLQARAPRFLAKPYAVMIHSIEIWRAERPDYHRSARNARFLIANSSYTADRSRRRYPDLAPIEVCWPGMDFERAGNAESPGHAARAPSMLIVGRLDSGQRHKGHDHLIEALEQVIPQIPGARLVVAGAGSDRERLEQKARDLGLASHVDFKGWVDNEQLHQLYRDSALFVMPSDGDGFGLVFLEAMARGLPCVGLKGSAAEEILDRGRAGILVDRDDLPDMAARLAALLSDANERELLGKAGAKRYREHFTHERFAERFGKTILEAMRP